MAQPRQHRRGGLFGCFLGLFLRGFAYPRSVPTAPVYLRWMGLSGADGPDISKTRSCGGPGSAMPPRTRAATV